VVWKAEMSSEPGNSETRSSAPLAGETCSRKALFVMGSDARVAPDWKSPT
jgi:hypothetical protein